MNSTTNSKARGIAPSARNNALSRANSEILGAYVNSTQLMKTFGIGRSTLLGLIKRGAFPKGIRLGRILRWSVSDIQAWIDSQNGANA